MGIFGETHRRLDLMANPGDLITESLGLSCLRDYLVPIIIFYKFKLTGFRSAIYDPRWLDSQPVVPPGTKLDSRNGPSG